MNVVECTSTLGIDSLKVGTRPTSPPSGTDVAVRVRATSLNYRDLMYINGAYLRGMLPKPGQVPLSDGSGEVVAIGAAVTRVKVGDRVSVVNLPLWIGGRLKAEFRLAGVGFSMDGMLREQAVFDQQYLVRIPDYMSFSEAASLPCAAVTAWAALTNGRSVEAGETVLVQGSGGVSLFALQFAKAFGARVIATTSSAAKAARLRQLGADEVIDYNARPDWDVAVRELTGGLGVDRVVEVTGPPTIQRSVNSTAVGGRIFLVGFLSGFEGSLNPMTLLTESVGIEGVSIGSREHFTSLLGAMKVHEIHPVIDAEYPFAKFKDAYRHMEASRYFGKIVITID